MDRSKKLALFLLSLTLLILVIAFSGAEESWMWGGLTFSGPPHAANGPGCNPASPLTQAGSGCPNNDPAYDLGAIWFASNSSHLGFQIFAQNLSSSRLCGGNKEVYYIVHVDSDKNISTGVPQNGNGMPGAETEIIVLNSSIYAVKVWNGSEFMTNLNKTSRLSFSPNDGNCSYPTMIRMALPKSDFAGLDLANGLMFIAASANTTGPLDILFPGGGMAQKPECPIYDNQGVFACVNQSNQHFGLFCKWEDDSGSSNASRGWCDPDFASMPQTCDNFCGYCSDSNQCSSFSSNRGPCKWENNVCNEMFAGGSVDCSTNCHSCFDENSCLNNGPKEGMGSACGWVDDPFSPSGSGGFCEDKAIAAQKDCSQNCFACADPNSCTTSTLGNCAWISNNLDWSNATKGNYTNSTYSGFMGCVRQGAAKEICFMPEDEDSDGLYNCDDNADCGNDPFCGFGMGGGMNIDCWTQDNTNQGTCEGFGSGGKCFWHSTPNGELLCDPLFMQQMIGGMSMDVPPTPIGEDASNDTNEAWLDIIHVGIKEEPDSIGVGFALRNLSSAAVCNKFFNGTQNSTFYRYVDTDENLTNGCSASNGTTNLSGFEYQFEYTTYWNGSETVENKISKKCAGASWIPYAAQVMSPSETCFVESPSFDFIQFKGINVLIIKYSDIGQPTGKLRIFVSSALNGALKDVAGPFVYKKGSIDFEPTDCFSNPASCGLAFMQTGGKYMPFEDCMMPLDEDLDGLINCEDSDCGMVPWCSSQFNQYLLNDEEAPEVVSSSVDKFPDFAFVTWMTNEPSNGTLELFKISSCNFLNRTNIYHDLGDPVMSFDDYKPFHGIPLENKSLDSNSNLTRINPNSTYFYKLTSCDRASNCAVSACLNFTTPSSASAFSLGFSPPPPAGDDNDFMGWVVPKIVINGTETDFSGSAMNFNYTINATLTLTNPNSTKPWGIDLEGVNLARAASINLTGLLNVQDSGGTTIVGMNGSLWQQLSQTLGIKTIKMKIPVTFDSNNKVYLRKCNDAGGGCQNSSGVWQYSPTTGNATNITSGECKLLNWSLVDPKFSDWRCPTSLGFSVFAVYLVEAGTSSSSSSSSGGGGGGASPSTTVYVVNDADFEKGYTTNLKSDEKLKIKVNEEDHSVQVMSMTSNTVTIKVESTPQQATLFSGEQKKFEVTGDNYYDLYVKVNDISNNSASISIGKINELTASAESNANATQEASVKTDDGAQKKITSDFPYLWIVLSVFIAAIIVFFVFKSRSKSDKV